MRILFDHQIMDAQTRGGVSRYFYNLVATIKSQSLDELALIRGFRLEGRCVNIRCSGRGQGLFYFSSPGSAAAASTFRQPWPRQVERARTRAVSWPSSLASSLGARFCSS